MARKFARKKKQTQQQTKAHEEPVTASAPPKPLKTIDSYALEPLDEDVEALGFAPPVAALSPGVRASLERVLAAAEADPAQRHLVVHMRKGLEQIARFLREQHTDADGRAFVDFEAMARGASMRWREHVNTALASQDMNVQARRLPRAALQLRLQAFDLKVGRPGRPDDVVYQKSAYAREFMPRGNCIARWVSPTTGDELCFPLVRAYRKFTGQEDDGEEKAAVGDEVLSKFFTKPMAQAQSVISTTKENGEAAHLAIIKRSDGAYLYVLGSKNTHLVVSSAEGIDAAVAAGKSDTGNPYKAAEPIARALFATLDGLEPAKREFLCEFLAQTRMTASFEMLCPGYQHVQLLDYLEEDTPVFYGFSFPTLEPVEGTEICVNPVLAYELMRWLGIRTVEYKVVPHTPEAMATVLAGIRSAYQHEGAVNLFLDDDACVIGMEKFKTTWYVCLRAIREKAKGFLNRALPKKRKGEDGSPEEIAAGALAGVIKALRGRFQAIQAYLRLSDDVCASYHALGVAFVTYLHDVALPACAWDAAQQKDLKERVATLFPVVWKEFLEHSGHNDRIIDTSTTTTTN